MAKSLSVDIDGYYRNIAADEVKVRASHNGKVLRVEAYTESQEECEDTLVYEEVAHKVIELTPKVREWISTLSEYCMVKEEGRDYIDQVSMYLDEAGIEHDGQEWEQVDHIPKEYIEKFEANRRHVYSAAVGLWTKLKQLDQE